MKKWLFILGCSLMLCGCTVPTESNIVSQGGDLSPDLETREGIELEWQQAFDEMSAQYLEDSEEQVIDLSFFMDDEEDGSETVYIVAIVDSAVSPQDGAQLATRMVKSMNDILADQDFSIARSANDSYGGIVSRYNMGVRVVPEDQSNDQSMALVDDVIRIGEAYRPVNANR